jgi:hypothetical protein
MKLCTPAWVYLFISIFGFLWNMTFSFRSALLQLLFIGIWTYILDFICRKVNVWVSWFLVLAPYVFAALVLLIAIEFMILNDMQMSSLESFLGMDRLKKLKSLKKMPKTSYESTLESFFGRKQRKNNSYR